MEQLVRADAVARHTDECVRTVYRKADAGIYPCYRSGRTLRFKLSEIEESMKGVNHDKKDGTRR